MLKSLLNFRSGRHPRAAGAHQVGTWDAVRGVLAEELRCGGARVCSLDHGRWKPRLAEAWRHAPAPGARHLALGRLGREFHGLGTYHRQESQRY